MQTARLSSRAQHALLTYEALTNAALANEAFANERIIVPTHDPAKPWPTRTPTPQPTPWFIPTATPVSTATSFPTSGSTAPAPSSSSTAVVAPTGAGPTMSAALPTPSTGTPADGASSAGSAAALDATRLEAATDVTPTEVAEITAAPADVAPTAEVPAADPAAGAPAATTTTADGAAPPEATATPGPAAFTPGDDAQFVTYLQSRYGALAGQTLDVAQVTLGQTPDNLPEVRVEVNVDPASNTFPGHTAEAQEYGRALLADAKVFYPGQRVAIDVVANLQSTTLDECTNSPGWCYVDGFDSNNDSWNVAWTYVKGRFDGGSDDVQAWSPAQ